MMNVNPKEIMTILRTVQEEMTASVNTIPSSQDHFKEFGHVIQGTGWELRMYFA
jgi:hypothetical protein